MSWTFARISETTVKWSFKVPLPPSLRLAVRLAWFVRAHLPESAHLPTNAVKTVPCIVPFLNLWEYFRIDCTLFLSLLYNCKIIIKITSSSSSTAFGLFAMNRKGSSFRICTSSYKRFKFFLSLSDVCFVLWIRIDWASILCWTLQSLECMMRII